AGIEKVITDSGRFDTAVSLADHISFVNREMNAAQPAMYRIPSQPDLVEQYLLLFSRSDLRSFVTPDFRRANILVRFQTYNSAQVQRHVAAVMGGVKMPPARDILLHV